MHDADIRRMAELVRGAARIAVLTGAGISTPSGIPDFRSSSGVYSMDFGENVFDVREFRRDPSAFYRFARWFYPLVAKAKPNAAHEVLAKWELQGKDVRIATQNIDDLHQRAGSQHVYPVHGTVLTSTCQSCRRSVESKELDPEQIPRCQCGGVFKPDITFFGEMLPEKAWEDSVRAMAEADLVLVVGTSLAVYPAASLPDQRRGNAGLAILNRDPTPLDRDADVVIHTDLAEALSAADLLL
jgi:NAD-dependent deacetylase